MANRSTDDFEDKRSKQILGVRLILDYLFGLVFIAVGIFSFFRFKGDNTMIVFGVVAILYGAWRLFKAFTKKGYQR